MKRTPIIVVSLLLIAASASARAFDFSGASLEQALEELEARGLAILYSSDLVKPGMQVLEPPASQGPRAILEEIVRPHGIRVAEGPGGLLLLTRGARVTRATARNESELQVAEVIVTASRYEWVRYSQPSITRLSDVELHRVPNVGDDPMRALARLPGAAASDLSAKLHVRGGAGDETLVRFDGVRLVNPFHLKDFQSVVSAIDPAVVGAIDVYTGGFPVQYGDRMSGVIDIHPARAGAVAGGELALSLFNSSLFAAGNLDHGRAGWSVAARRGNLDRVLDWSGVNLGRPAYSDLYARVGRQLGRSASLSANLLQFDDDLDLSDTDFEERARADYRDRYVWLRLDAHPRESLSGSVILARTDLESRRRGAAEQPGISTGVLEDEREFSIDSLQTDWSWRATDRMELRFGGEQRRSDGTYRHRSEAQFDVAFASRGAAVERSRTLDIAHRARGDYYGGYADMRAEIAEPLVVEAGVRWDRSTFGEDRGDLSPRVGVRYRVDDYSRLSASWGRFVQTQGVDELPVADGVLAFADAQEAAHWLISFERRLTPDVDLRLELYRKDYDGLRSRFENLLNTAVLLPELKPDRVEIDARRARADGVELSLRSVRSQPLSWWVSYTWARTEDIFDERKELRSWDQRHALSAGVVWQSERWDLSLAAAWRSGWPTPELEALSVGDDAVVRVHSNTNRLRTYGAIDARIARKFHVGADSTLTAFFEVRNAFQRRNECCIEFEIDEETGESAFVIESIRGLPLLPSAGVIWRF